MPRFLPGPSETDLETALIKKSVDTLEAGRRACADCGRTPLVGERVYRYGRGITVCELCRTLRRDDPESSQLVHHSEHGQAVRIVVRRAA